MTDLQNHIVAVMDNPDDKTAALALADHFQETSAPERTAALRKVAAVRRAKRRTRELKHATRLLSITSAVQPVMMNAILFAVGFQFGDRASVIVVEGRGRPRVIEGKSWRASPHTGTSVIVVPARWVLDTERILTNPINPPLTIAAGTWPAA